MEKININHIIKDGEVYVNRRDLLCALVDYEQSLDEKQIPIIEVIIRTLERIQSKG